jgi:magnesium transporter
MDVYLVSDTGVKPCPVEDLDDVLQLTDVLVWVDIPRCDGRTAMVLSETFGFHDIAIRDCLERNHMSKIHVYDDHVFTVLHAPEVGSRGHVHYVELDQFLGPNYLVTVHGPLNPASTRRCRSWTPNRSGSGSTAAGCTPNRRSSCRPRSCPR